MLFKATETFYGTTGSIFTQVASFENARTGYRALGNDAFRVRVEVAPGTKLNLPDWKQPDYSQSRYSTVVEGIDSVKSALTEAAEAIVEANVVDPNAETLAQIADLKAQIEALEATLV